MATNNPAFAELFELIEEQKTTMPEYAYMKMMECMMKINTKKEVDEDERLDLRNLRDRNTLLTHRLFCAFHDKKRCSICKNTDHTRGRCKITETIIIKDCGELAIDYDAQLYMYVYKLEAGYDLLEDVVTGNTIGRVYPVDKEFTPNEMIDNIILPHPTDPTRKLQMWVRSIERHMINDPSTSVGMFN